MQSRATGFDAGAAARARTSERTQQRVNVRATERKEERRLERPHRGIMTDDTGLAIDMSRIPEGFTMQWKRHSLLGMNDRRNQVVVRQHHWAPVPHKMQPHILGHTCENEDEHIIVGGLGLYMRPSYLDEDAEKERIAETDYVLSQQLQSLRLTSKQQVGEKNTRIRRTVEAVSQPIE